MQGNGLWDFSLAFYAVSEAQKALLSLQDDEGADVNLLLFLLYQSTLKRVLAQAEIQIIDQQISDFRNTIVKPIRALRISHKDKVFGNDETLYSQLLDLELSAEKVQQTQLSQVNFEWLEGTDVLQSARSNLHSYTILLGMNEHSEAIEVLIKRLTELGLF
ncbi:TIGR02444 family protein [Leucothrix sargassi]|nr:TIGR02444 family protein [Leucothrix sargassi]